MKVIAITGGIGSGKSVVCRILTALGYPVYDCDSRAKAIMDSDLSIKRGLREQIADDVINADGGIDRKRLAEIVFNDADKLNTLNALVHQAVRDDIYRWIQVQTRDMAFVETAILYQSGLDRMVDEVWCVTAPVDICIDRVCRRNATTPEAVKARIDSQCHTPEHPHPHVHQIVNDGNHSILLQLHSLI